MARPITFKIEDLIITAENYLEKVKKGEIDFPSLTAVMLEVRINKETWRKKCDESPELNATSEEIKYYQELKLQEKGITRLWDPGMVKFLLSANHGMSEIKKVEDVTKQNFDKLSPEKRQQLLELLKEAND